MRRVWETGSERRDRTGVGTRALFGATLRFDLSDGSVPLLTTKRVFWKSAVKELIWFLNGETSIRPLVAQGVHIWTDWPLDAYRRATGEPIDPASTYTVASGSFLIGGGDNFSVLAEGADRKDTGLIDTDAFVNYFSARDVVEPDFRKQAIAVSDAPSELTEGDEVSFTVSDVDLTSLGAPDNTEVEVFVGDTSVGTFPVSSESIDGTPTRKGSADVSFTVPDGLEAGAATLRIVAAPSDSQATLPVTVVTDDEPMLSVYRDEAEQARPANVVKL